MLILVLRVSVVRADAPMILQTFLSRLQNGNADPAINSLQPRLTLQKRGTTGALARWCCGF